MSGGHQREIIPIFRYINLAIISAIIVNVKGIFKSMSVRRNLLSVRRSLPKKFIKFIITMNISRIN